MSHHRFILRATALTLVSLIAAIALATHGHAGSFYEVGDRGYDISFPQCGTRLPRADFGIVGVTNGLPWSTNPCLKAQYQWASSLDRPASFYTNTANPGPISAYWKQPGPRTCTDYSSYDDTGCSYNYGWNAAAQAFTAASTATSPAIAASRYWWLDVETMNSWNGSTAANSATVQGYVDYFVSRGVAGLGVYSTAAQWDFITGSLALPTLPNWVAGARSAKGISRFCGAGFTGGPVLLVQYREKNLSRDYVCE